MAVAGVGGADVKARIDAILANRIGLRLTLSKRLVLAAVAVLSLTVPIVTGAIEAAAFAAGQLSNPLIGPAIDPESRFEVVSIKLSDASAQLRLGMTPGRLDLAGAPLRVLVAMVFPLGQGRVFGWPDGIDAERYTISAKMPDGAPLAARQVAIRNLLKDRFKLVTHQETRELPIYNLVLARSDGRLGPALKESSAECQAAAREYFEAIRRGAPTQAPPAAVARCVSSLPGPGSFSMNGGSMGSLVNVLPQFVGRQVIDRTGLTGIYDFALKWMPEPAIGTSLLGPAAGPATARGSRCAEHLHRAAGAARAEAGSRPRPGGSRRHRSPREADAGLVVCPSQITPAAPLPPHRASVRGGGPGLSRPENRGRSRCTVLFQLIHPTSPVLILMAMLARTPSSPGARRLVPAPHRADSTSPGCRRFPVPAGRTRVARAAGRRGRGSIRLGGQRRAARIDP